MNNQIRKGDVIYHPTSPDKYIGKGNIVCRSSWEVIFCRWCCGNPAVLEWASEPLAIPYIDKTSKDKKGLPKKRRYYPDFLCKILDRHGNVNTWLIEVKPYNQTVQPIRRKNKTMKTMLYEEKTWAVNSAKWKSAIAFCKRRGWVFKILTEKQLIKR